MIKNKQRTFVYFLNDSFVTSLMTASLMFCIYVYCCNTPCLFIVIHTVTSVIWLQTCIHYLGQRITLLFFFIVYSDVSNILGLIYVRKSQECTFTVSNLTLLGSFKNYCSGKKKHVKFSATFTFYIFYSFSLNNIYLHLPSQ